jgi:very-short-patch-repair endonuclease
LYVVASDGGTGPWVGSYDSGGSKVFVPFTKGDNRGFFSMLKYDSGLKQQARYLRANMTGAERKLWFHIRRKQLLGVQFVRQKPIAGYVVDFYAARPDIVIEVDGAQHVDKSSSRARADKKRDAALRRLGLRIMRFSNLDVLYDTDNVVDKIRETVKRQLKNPPYSPFRKGGNIARKVAGGTGERALLSRRAGRRPDIRR